MNKNIGLFFGTFDPLHNGHIAIAKYFLKEVNLDEILLLRTSNCIVVLYSTPIPLVPWNWRV